MLQTLALATLMSFAPAQGDDDLKLTNARPTYGVQGAPRADTKLLPGDLFWLSFDIENITINPETGVALYSMGFELLDDKGNKKFGKKPQEVEAPSFFGGSTLPGYAHVEIGTDTDPGNYTMVVTVVDRATNPKKTATLKRTFEVLPKTFGFTRVSTSFDPDGRLNAPNIGVTGQFYWINFVVVGFERKDKEPKVSLEMRILDDKGKPTIGKPLTGEADKAPANATYLAMQFQVNLNRPGKFTIQLKATDQLSKKTAEVSFPLIVMESSPK